MDMETDFDGFRQELRALLAKYNVSIGVEIEGDTHCLSTNFVVESNGSYYERKQVVLDYYTQMINASDIKD